MLYKTFIIIIFYMFRATIVLSVSDRPVCTPEVTYREYYTRCYINTILPPDDEHSVARNM